MDRKNFPKNFQKTIDYQTIGCHTWYMEKLFENVINEHVIDNLTNEQVDELLAILKGI